MISSAVLTSDYSGHVEQGGGGGSWERNAECQEGRDAAGMDGVGSGEGVYPSRLGGLRHSELPQ